MRKKGISPEYLYVPVNGSLNMKESRSFFGSKMMDIEDSVILDKRDIVYYQQFNGEQIDYTQELNLSPYIYSISNDKLNNHIFASDPTQTDIDKENKTKWVLEINLKELLKNYIYAQIKNNRTFNGVLNENTANKSVNTSIYDYIDENIIERYAYTSIKFFISYISLEQNINRYEVKYDPDIEVDENILKNIRTVFSEDESMVRVFFTQEKSSKDYTFNYYFNLHFIKK